MGSAGAACDATQQLPPGAAVKRRGMLLATALLPVAASAFSPSPACAHAQPAQVQPAAADDVAAAASADGAATPKPPPQQVPWCYVGRGGTGGAETGAGQGGTPRFESIAEAVERCPAGALVLVEAGRYPERLLLSSPVTIASHPPGAQVEVVWETSRPYESTVEITAPEAAGGGAAGDADGAGGTVTLRGLTIRHASKSVANNFGVFVKAGSPRLERCDISSSTGAGVGVEAAAPLLLRCRVHGCARQGVAIFGGLDDGFAGAYGGTVQDCEVDSNALDGVLVRGGASPDLIDNIVHDNGGWGFSLQDAYGRYEGNVVSGNRAGAVAVSALFEGGADALPLRNSLTGLFQQL